MSKIIACIKRFGVFLLHHPLKTAWFNFKMLPFEQAIHLPILLYGKTSFRGLRGGVKIQCKNVYPFMIKIGCDNSYVATSSPKSIWTIEGTLILNGPVCFLQGTYILIAKGAELNIGGNGTFVGSNTKIICFEKISIGNMVHITWDCQLYDTSFHYIQDVEGNCLRLTKPIRIGNKVWIGNNTTISKGCVLPDNTIIGSHSLANKDYTDTKGGCLLAGIPARVKIENIYRVYNEEQQSVLDAKFDYHRVRL